MEQKEELEDETNICCVFGGGAVACGGMYREQHPLSGHQARHRGHGGRGSAVGGRDRLVATYRHYAIEGDHRHTCGRHNACGAYRGRRVERRVSGRLRHAHAALRHAVALPVVRVDGHGRADYRALLPCRQPDRRGRDRCREPYRYGLRAYGLRPELNGRDRP